MSFRCMEIDPTTTLPPLVPNQGLLGEGIGCQLHTMCSPASTKDLMLTRGRSRENLETASFKHTNKSEKHASEHLQPI